MHLLERETILADLDGLLQDARAGAGRIAAIAGEAGAGKTSLIEQFVATRGANASALWGMCDPLSTPRPLGPVHDIATQTSGPLAAALRESSREGVLSAFVTELGLPPVPRIVVVEDAHWADDATLDLLKFIGRRIRRLATLLVITYRDDEVGPTHQLHRFLGELPPDAMRWLHLPLLSEAAVEEMAVRKQRPSDGLYALTGGNPFFVAEILASGEGVVPASIKEAVLARATRLSTEARNLLDVVSVVPGRAGRPLLQAMVDGAAARIRECVALGILVVAPGGVGFRHELARIAWQETLEPGAAAGLHARTLEALLTLPDDERALARIVHHADEAGDREHVLRFAPAAAREAAVLGAHRQAASHYATALRHGGDLPPAERAALLEGLSYERHLVGDRNEAIRASEDALALRISIGDRHGEGANLCGLSRLAWMDGRRVAAVAFAENAVAVLDPLGPTAKLSIAHSNLAFLRMTGDDADSALTHGERALALAEQLVDVESLAHALTTLGSVERLTSRKDAGLRRLEQSIELALAHGVHEHVTRAYTNIACVDLWHRNYERSAENMELALQFTSDNELESLELYVRGWRSRLELERGNWDAAERDVTIVLGQRDTPAIVRCQPLIVLALLRARRGERDADTPIEEALSIAGLTAELQRVGPAVAARTEIAWLRDELDGVRRDLGVAWQAARRGTDRWGVQGWLAWWLWRAGDLAVAPDGIPEPVHLQIEGDWRAAAHAWERIGAPYERALALAQGDTPDAWHDALAGLDSLGAHAAAAAVRRDLRRRGVRGLPRGPYRTARRRADGLTAAQVRVLEQLTRGLSNADIARELCLSPRTVDHHVSAILAKLGVPTRAAAIAATHERRLLNKT